MAHVFILHGFEGTPNGGWRPWLMAELAARNVYAASLSLPSPSQPKLNEWLEALRVQLAWVPTGESVYLVGHSLGATAIMRYLESLPENTIEGALLVSGPLYSEGRQEPVAAFLRDSWRAEAMMRAVRKVAVIHAEDDALVSVAEAKGIVDVFQQKAELHLLPQGGHLNGSAGVRELPIALEVLERWMTGEPHE